MKPKDAVYWLNNLIGNYSDYYDDALEIGVKALEQQEIVRCGDCQYFMMECQVPYCRMWNNYTTTNGYCHNAKRVEGRTDD